MSDLADACSGQYRGRSALVPTQSYTQHVFFFFFLLDILLSIGNDLLVINRQHKPFLSQKSNKSVQPR